jgi:hypothetical protein
MLSLLGHYRLRGQTSLCAARVYNRAFNPDFDLTITSSATDRGYVLKLQRIGSLYTCMLSAASVASIPLGQRCNVNIAEPTFSAEFDATLVAAQLSVQADGSIRLATRWTVRGDVHFPGLLAAVPVFGATVSSDVAGPRQ